MRAIKFRGKCVPDSKYAGEWVTGGYVAPEADAKKQDEGLIICYFGGNATCTYHVMPETVGQFTGLYDNDGQEIYEGDILIIEGIKIDRRYIVTWNPQKYSFYIGNSPIIAYLDRIGNKIEGYRVCGNIHDNPELVKY